MTEGKSINLLKAAKELNIGIGTAVEFLAKKGYDIEAKPNTKLNGDMYDVLSKEFQGDKIVKEEANQIVIGKIRRDEAPIETVTSKPAADVEHDEILIKNNSAFDPSVEEPKTNTYQKAPQPQPEEERSFKPEPKKEEEQEGPRGVKVVGKIDLSSLNQRNRPEKRPAATPAIETPKAEKPEVPPTPVNQEEAPVQTKEPEEKQEEKPQATEKKEIPVQPEKQAEIPTTEIKPEKSPEEKEVQQPTGQANPNEVIRARAEHLSGPKVIGKIELPTPHQRRKDQPVASSSGANAVGANDHKRKRKRNNNLSGGGQNRQQTGGDAPHKPHVPGAQNKPSANQPGAGSRNENRPGHKGKHDFKGRGRHVETPKEEP